MSVSVNEVGITFHAINTQQLPVLDLKQEEVDVFDNDNGPGRVVSMELLGNRPIHAGFLIDTSGSVAARLSRSRVEAQAIVQKVLALPTDEGFAVAFGRSRQVFQSWTNQKDRLIESIGPIGTERQNPLDGTSIFDTLFSTCTYEFGNHSKTSATNVIYLFSDGVDTASFVAIRAAIDKCRENRTVIYAFSPKPTPELTTTGPSILRQLTEQTGGRLFYVSDSVSDMSLDIDTLGTALKDEYFLVYRPTTLNHDGSFHRIVLVGPKRVAVIVGTSGFYAPNR